ncbi:MAG: hypothetical protein HZB37_09695 [Planctomycetes bacterium]|nr:hypothetical protein [Planctomycetota bacterium]
MVLFGIGCGDVFADVSYADLFLHGKGFKPVAEDASSKSAMPFPLAENDIPDNPYYREWCVNTFDNGVQIYDAYKKIAFDIEYRSEPPKTDYWQTPDETMQSKQGDCEDSVFFLVSRLAKWEIDGEIVWGWVTDRLRPIAFAHVWYQIYDKQGKAYVVEGFSKEWNGIIPTEIIGETEKRIPTLILRHNLVRQALEEQVSDQEDSQAWMGKESIEDLQFSWDIFFMKSPVVSGIFFKLQDMLSRCKSGIEFR